MKKMAKRSLSFTLAFVMLFTAVWVFALSVGADDASPSPKRYYVGDGDTITIGTDFSDWADKELVTVDSAVNPENWQSAAGAASGLDIKYSYALTYDNDNFYYYFEFAGEASVLTATTSPRLFLSIVDADAEYKATNWSMLLDINYDGTNMVANRLHYRAATETGMTAGTNHNTAAAVTSELGSDYMYWAQEGTGETAVTKIEVSIPWEYAIGGDYVLNKADTFLYSLSCVSNGTGTSVYNFDMLPAIADAKLAPWTSNTIYPRMVFTPEYEDLTRSPKQYYAGANSSAITIGTDFSDWASQDIVKISSANNPENWQDPAGGNDQSYGYAFAYDNDNLYFYFEYDGPAANLNSVTAPRLFVSVVDDSAATKATTWTLLLDFTYVNEKISYQRINARNYPGSNSQAAGFVQGDNTVSDQIDLLLGGNSYHWEEIDGNSSYEKLTRFEVAIPWEIAAGNADYVFDKLNDSFYYGVSCMDANGATSLHCYDQSEWKLNDANQDRSPWGGKANELYPQLFLGEGTVEVTYKDPHFGALDSEDLAIGQSTDINVSKGKKVFGTVPGYYKADLSVLTDGALPTVGYNTNSDTVGYRITRKDMGGDVYLDAADTVDGKVNFGVDLGSVQSVYKFSFDLARFAPTALLVPEAIEVYGSVNGYTYQKLGEIDPTVYESVESGTLTGANAFWEYTLTLDESVKLRYFKIVLTAPIRTDNTLMAVAEVTAYQQVEMVQGTGTIGMTNNYWPTTGAAGNFPIILTEEGKTGIEILGGDWLNWWNAGVYEWDADKDAFVLTAIDFTMSETASAAKTALVVPENGFILLTNGNTLAGNEAHTLFGLQRVGDTAQLTGLGLSDLASLGRVQLESPISIHFNAASDDVAGCYDPTYRFNDSAVDPETALELKNLALGMSYTTTMPGSKVYDAAPDNATTPKLTDGKWATGGNAYDNVDILGFVRASGTQLADTIFDFDFGESKEISAFRIQTLGGGGSGIVHPAITVHVSEDGETWKTLSGFSMTESNVGTTNTNTWGDNVLILDNTVNARYVKIDMKATVFVFTGEVEIYGKSFTIETIGAKYATAENLENEDSAIKVGATIENQTGETIVGIGFFAFPTGMLGDDDLKDKGSSSAFVAQTGETINEMSVINMWFEIEAEWAIGYGEIQVMAYAELESGEFIYSDIITCDYDAYLDSVAP